MPPVLDSLPALYRNLLPAFFERDFPEETKATCASCAMCEDSCREPVVSVDGVNRFFRPDTKCCTYYPRLPNYLVGGLLSDPDPRMAEGARRVREKISRRLGATPQWVKPPAKYTLLYGNAHQAFGRNATLRCPYFDQAGGGCTLWAWREAVCSTYFCKYVAGADGRKLWMSLKTYLSIVEIQLTRYAALKLCPDYILSGKDKDDARTQPLSAQELDEQPLPEKEYAQLWHGWVGREEEFYKACYETVRSLGREDVERMLGLDGTIELAVLEKLYQAATGPSLPKVLKLNPGATIKWLPDGSVAMASYSEFDAVALPGEAYGLLVEFTGRESVEAVRQRLRDQKQADLSEDVLRELYRHRILTEAS